MKKIIFNFDLHLVLVITLIVISLWPLSCMASSSNPALPLAENKQQPSADEPPNQKSISGETDCVRGEPEPVLKKGTFKRLSKFTAEETYRLDENVTLTIQHGGCAHFFQSYRFRVKTDSQIKKDWRQWMNLAADLLIALPVRDVESALIGQMAKDLRGRAGSKADYLYKTEIPMSEIELLSLDVRMIGNDIAEVVVDFDVAL